jgi:putative peptidoglycan lipid II flippase
VQLSALLDVFLASLLPTGANAALGYVQTLYVLPVSLFGVGEAAAALPEMARETASQSPEERHTALRRRLGESLTRVGFTTIPTTVCFGVLGSVIVGAIFQTGKFDRTATELVAAALAAYVLGLLANASVRVLASAYYALSDTKTPAKLAVYRVAVSAALSYTLQLKFQIVGLCLGAASAGWIEALVLGGVLRHRLGGLPLDGRRWLKFIVASAAAAVVGYGAMIGCTRALGATGQIARLVLAAVSLTAFGTTYLGVAYALRTPDVRDFVAAVRRRLGRRG